jgi:hypothetical protein
MVLDDFQVDAVAGLADDADIARVECARNHKCHDA